MRRWLVLAPLLPSILLVDSSCSSTESAAPAVTPIEIGSLSALTGDLAGTGKDNVDSANLAVEQINAAGGVLGRPLKLLVQDDRTTVDGARTGYSNLLGSKVPVIIGPTSSAAVAAIADLIASGRTLTIGRTATSTALTTLPDDDYFFRLAPSDVYQGKVLAKLVREANLTKLCLVHRDDTYGTKLADVITQELGTSVELVRSAYNPTSGDLSKVIDKCEPLRCAPAQVDAGADDAAADASVTDASAPCTPAADGTLGLMMVTFVADGAVIIDDAAKRGWDAAKQRFFFTDGVRDTEIPKLVARPQILEGTMGTLPSGPDPSTPDGERLRQFYAAYQKRYGVTTPGFVQNAYEAVYLAAGSIELAGVANSGTAARDALRKINDPAGQIVGPPDWQGMRDAIRAHKPINYQGVGGNVDFDANGDVVPPVYYRVWRFSGGQISTVRIERIDG